MGIALQVGFPGLQTNISLILSVTASSICWVLSVVD